MGLFSRFEFGKKSEVAKNDATDGWDSLKNIPPQQAGEQIDELAQANTERQQRKIIACMLYDIKYLSEPDVIIPEEVEEDFLEQLNSGKISKDDQKNFLRKIGDPVRLNGAAAVNEQLGDNKHFRRILGYAINGANGFNDYGSAIQNNAIDDFAEIFPTPIDFEGVRDRLLDGIRQSNSEEKYREYEKDMEQFQQIMYGKKYEYYKSLLDLKEKNKDMAGSKIKYETMDYTDAEREQILDNAIIDGDDFIYDSKPYRLTNEVLREVGLGPEHKVVFEGMEVGLSGHFSVSGRDAVLGYVKTDDGYKVRGYYRSGSQSAWRYLPDYASRDEGLWYGKGYTEEMLTLPCELQAELSKIAMQERIPVEQKTLPIFVLAGTAKSWPSMEAYYLAKINHKLRGDIYKETNAYPLVNFGVLGEDKHSPESISVNGALAPNYKNELASWKSNTAVYGNITNRVFRSFDGKLKYTISEDDNGRCFVSSIETNARPTSCGTRREWVSGGDVSTPLYEYAQMSDGYGDPDDSRGGYVGMWKNYVSKLKIIRDYLTRGDKKY